MLHVFYCNRKAYLMFLFLSLSILPWCGIVFSITKFFSLFPGCGLYSVLLRADDVVRSESYIAEL